jgi:putative spermidine/putrescine transport system ATP-binding protein
MDVRLTDLRFTANGRQVLSIPHLDIRARRTTAVLGPNGAGKTTLLRLIAGLERSTTGQVLVGGESAERGPRRVAFAFQEEVFLRRSIRDNLELGLSIQGASALQARERAIEALRLLQIEALADRRADQVSGGERRRASLARALSLRMPVVLLDEPMAGLDGTTYSRLLDELPQLLGAGGPTCVLVTHDPEEAFRLADDLIVLVGGSVLAAGAKADVAAGPMREDVARTLGYTVLKQGARRVAIPNRSLSMGNGSIEFAATADAVIDLVSSWDVIVNVGQVQVHVQLSRAATPPDPGERLFVHASIAHDVLD